MLLVRYLAVSRVILTAYYYTQTISYTLTGFRTPPIERLLLRPDYGVIERHPHGIVTFPGQYVLAAVIEPRLEVFVVWIPVHSEPRGRG